MKLFEPVTINGLTLANRVVLPAMVTRLSGEDGFVNDDIRRRYLRFARGGPGLIVVEAMSVHGGKSGPLLRLSSDEFVPGHADLARRIHDISPSKVVPQIIHFLKIARSGWRQKVADLGPEDLSEIVAQHGAAAGRARAAGYDGVELHMAHAYTLSSFLSRLNRRPDDYGRSLENRMRLPVEVIRRVRAEVGADFPVGVRFDGEECIKDGYTVVDAREIALRMAREGVDWISVSAGGKFEDAIHKPGQPLYPYTGYSGDRCMPGAAYPDGANASLPEAIKRHLNAHGLFTPVVATGKIRTPELAEALLAEGRADLIGMARALLADPDWVRKVASGRSDHLVRCVYGNICKNLDENFRKVVCVLWPKGSLQAPASDDAVAPRWGETGAALRAEAAPSGVRVSWAEATDNEAVYGYEILRSVDGGSFEHVHSVKTTCWTDHAVAAGARYRYAVRAYDLAGNRTPTSNAADIELAADAGAGSGPAKAAGEAAS